MSGVALNIPGLAPGEDYEIEVAYGAPGRETSGFTALGTVTTGSLVPETAKVTDAVRYFGSGTVSISNNTATLVSTLTMTTDGEAVDITVSGDLKVSSGQECDLLVTVDATYTYNATSPTFAAPGDGRKAQVKTGIGSDFRYPVNFKHSIGSDAGTNPPLAAGSHDFRFYIRNHTGAGATMDDIYFEVRKQLNDTPV